VNKNKLTDVFQQELENQLEQHDLLRYKAQKKWLAGAAANHLSESRF